MNLQTLRVGIDVGSTRHRVAAGLPDGKLIDEFDVDHHADGFSQFFRRIGLLEKRHQLPVSVAMEGYNGWARPLDAQIHRHGWQRYSVNNLKLARYKEIFPAPAKTNAIDASRILELFQLAARLPVARNALQEVKPTPVVNEQLKLWKTYENICENIWVKHMGSGLLLSYFSCCDLLLHRTGAFIDSSLKLQFHSSNLRI